MHALPCPLCGYDAPGAECGHCRLQVGLASLQGPPPRWYAAVWTGVRALPEGLVLLVRTRGIRVFLLPPMLLTMIAFVAIFAGIWSLVGAMFDAIQVGDLDRLDEHAGWVRWIAEKIVATKVLVWVMELGRWVFFVAASALVAVWAFSIVYEAIAGPFLDEIQGRLEERWFGTDPRKAIHRPTQLPARTCAIYSAFAGTATILMLAAAWGAGGAAGTWLAALSPLPWVVLAIARPEWGKWLLWVIRTESRTLWVSVQAAVFAGVVLVLFLWLKLVPWIGPPLFFALAGFTVALSLLDIPFSRRQWSLSTRLAFLRANWPALIAFGSVSSLVYLIPVVGQVVMVPAASIGGLWLVCRLDKNSLRPADRRIAYGRAGAAAGARAG